IDWVVWPVSSRPMASVVTASGTMKPTANLALRPIFKALANAVFFRCVDAAMVGQPVVQSAQAYPQGFGRTGLVTPECGDGAVDQVLLDLLQGGADTD